tara:strand:+ start:374 stop:526 length:153 start_codon:yes stop_codon:yes gene_type:complete
MTFNGCRNQIEQTLSKMGGVTSTSVILDKKNVNIEMKSHIPNETFMKALK